MIESLSQQHLSHDLTEGSSDLSAYPSDSIWDHKCLYCIATLWLVGTFYAFWYFLVSDYRDFYSVKEKQLAVFEKTIFSNTVEAYARDLASTHGKPAQGYVFHFWNPNCSCDKFNKAHVERLVNDYGKSGFQFVVIPKPGSTVSAQRWKASLGQNGQYVHIVDMHFSAAAAVPASPAAAVLNSEGKLVFFGPYSLGGICKANENGLIEQVLQGLTEHREPINTYVSGFGCFCKWSD